MKKVFLGLLFLCISLLANMNFMEYDKATALVKKENKILMIMLSRSTCKVCNFMKENVFTNEEIIEKFNERFVGVILELDFDDIPKDLPAIGTPTFYFLDKNGEKIHRINGGKSVPSFFKALDSVH